jgi:hypothetical protein
MELVEQLEMQQSTELPLRTLLCQAQDSARPLAAVGEDLDLLSRAFGVPASRIAT